MTPTPEWLTESRAAEEAATKGPWFFHYAGVYSTPLTKLFNQLEAEGRDDEAPETSVAWVPTVSGDTPTAQGLADEKAIAMMRNQWRFLLELVEEAAADIAHDSSCVADLKGEEWCDCGVTDWLARFNAGPDVKEER